MFDSTHKRLTARGAALVAVIAMGVVLGIVVWAWYESSAPSSSRSSSCFSLRSARGSS